ncbi:SDR family oxidoreductase [Streptomyces heilongjiangensis]|uniref:SDR family oxidoreductase n=1 Tax=Streptomyces heilongjiangensis TaxID=945052 RepID=A0ABW1BCF4_9ACTN|nr:SDR family oxidoreductase [Streptomyces heilongjiangensis]MDC2948973.1 SDR family NAD(P)-dependent oxidoreductase [Streptomyces heilongjiangensis]
MSQDTMDLTGLRVLVTGAAGGLGRAIAEAAHAAGAHLILTTRTADSLPRAAAGLDGPPEVVTAVADVTNDAELAAAVKLATERLGGIDVLVNNAGVSGPVGPAWENGPAEWRHTLEVNLEGPLAACRAVLPGMIERGHGRVVTVSSHAGHTRWPYVSAYSVSKAAVNKLTENLAIELLPHGITAFSYHPGMVNVGLGAPAGEDQDGDDPWRRRLSSWLDAQREAGRFAPLDAAVGNLLRLVRGDADPLTGRYLTYEDDIEALAAATGHV